MMNFGCMGHNQENKMKSSEKREKALGIAMACMLAFLVAPGLFGDDKKPTTSNTSGHTTQTHAAPQQHSAPPRSMPSGGGGAAHSNSTPVHSNPNNRNSTPSTNVNRTPTYNPGNRTTTGGNNTNPGGTHTNNSPNYNPGNRNTGNNPSYNPGNRNAGGNSTPNYNPGNRNNNPSFNPGNRGGGNNSYGPGNNSGNRAWHAPQGATASNRPGGGMTYTHGNTQYRTNQSGQLTHVSRPGADARFNNNGHIASAHFTRPDHSQVYVNRGPRGERTVVTVRADHTRVVSYGPRRGYMERPMVGRPGYISRTYVVGGRSYVRVYHTYYYRGFAYYRYVPPVYYAPAFYGWAYSPWVRPVYYRWGWFGTPWFGFYGGYFAPAPYYPTASLWLTDYLLAENLRLAYESQQQAAANAQYQQQYQQPPQQYPQNSQVTLTPEVKAAIAEEVRQQLEAERAAAGQAPGPGQPTGGYGQPQQPGGYSQTAQTGGDVAPPALDPKQRIFVVSSNLDVAVAGQGCSLTPGDIILRTGDSVGSDGTIGVSVLSSKPGDCPVNSAASVDVAALQEMHNQFREQIDAGMQQLAQNQGQGGLPAAPPAGARNFAEGQAPADSAQSVQSALMQQQTDAGQAETELQQAVNVGGGGGQ
jgi:hypothetical protein